MRIMKLMLLFLCMAIAGSANAQENGLYSTLDKTVAGAVQDKENVVEFFSFYCPPCYAFSQEYGIDKAVRENLPADGKMVKYHVGFLGSLGEELTRAWSVAMVMGIEDKMEPLLFQAVQITRELKSSKDIRNVFVRAGVLPSEYDRMLTSPEVADMTAKQKRLFREYGVTGTPSVYVNGRYRIENSAFRADSVEDFRKRYVAAVTSLLQEQTDK